jgi:hypothetical protein
MNDCRLLRRQTLPKTRRHEVSCSLFKAAPNAPSLTRPGLWLALAALRGEDIGLLPPQCPQIGSRPAGARSCQGSARHESAAADPCLYPPQRQNRRANRGGKAGNAGHGQPVDSDLNQGPGHGSLLHLYRASALNIDYNVLHTPANFQKTQHHYAIPSIRGIGLNSAIGRLCLAQGAAGLRSVSTLVRPANDHGAQAPRQRVPASLRAWATLPACDTRPTSFFVVPILTGLSRFFFGIPPAAVRPGSG